MNAGRHEGNCVNSRPFFRIARSLKSHPEKDYEERIEPPVCGRLWSARPLNAPSFVQMYPIFKQMLKNSIRK
jgi:hypothetical protein